ncbi:zinc-binding dehydrogenase [Leucobacter allii]|uniref:zinc-binding dehydrogenase n=1 Tax=Leucobacter allii TaxID=2932247 RepID=UPI001FD4BAD8|nr:zinc-binding dehydrogenase [Leucobacter allii]UOR01913.1 zinc-binding dehydrogenase [Leucobacter allii]
MKALVLDEIGGEYRMADVDIDVPIGREVLVDVKASGLCHSDLTASALGGWPVPAILGHEISGVVAAVGPDARGFTVGDHVVASLQSHCERCPACVRDDINMCEKPGFVARPDGERPRLSLGGIPVTAVAQLGGFAEQVLVHENNLVRIDRPIPHELACILGCGVLAGAGAVLNAAEVPSGATVAVYGCGGLGLAAIQAAVIAGASSIVAVDVSDEKLAYAERFGATERVDSLATDPVATIHELTGGGADFVFDFVGRPEVTQQAYASVGRAGELGVVGINRPGATLEIGIGPDFIWNQVRIRPIFNGSTNFRRDIPRFVELFAEGRFKLDELVSRTVTLAEVNDAYARMAGSVGRTVVTFP